MMSQNGTTPTTDTNRLPPSSNIPNPIFVPILPMFFPYANTNTGGQAYYTPNVYSNVPTYSSTGNHRHGNFGYTYNPFYAPFYPSANSLLPATTTTTHLTSSTAAMIPTRPLMMPPLLPLPQQDSSTTRTLVNENESERNKNLNIRECQSPVNEQTTRPREPLKIIDPSNTISKSEEHSSSASSLISHAESEQNPLPQSTSSTIQEIDADNLQDDFLTFIEQKTKTIGMPELNPLANEFSFENSQTLINDSSVTTNGIHQQQQQQDNQSSYRVLFDNLIEKSLESIEAIKRSQKISHVHDVSIQCTPNDDSTNRSTQTPDITNNHHELMEEYSQRTLKLMDQLLEQFRHIYQADLHPQCKNMAQTCDELRHLVSFMHHVILSSKNDQSSSSSISSSSMDLDNPFNNMIEQLANNMTHTNRYQTSTQMMLTNAGRGTRRLMTSTGNLTLPSFSCRQIDPIVTTTTKLCLLCRKAIHDTDDVMHKLCRALSFSPDMFNDT